MNGVYVIAHIFRKGHLGGNLFLTFVKYSFKLIFRQPGCLELLKVEFSLFPSTSIAVTLYFDVIKSTL